MAAALSSPPTGVSLAPFAKLPTGEEPSNAIQELTRRAKEAADLFKKTGSFTPKPAGPAPEDFAPPGAVPVDEVSPDSFAPKSAVPVDEASLVTADPANPLSKPVEALAKDASFDPIEFYKAHSEKLNPAEQRKLAEVYSARTESSPDKLGMIGEFAKGTVRALPAVYEMGKTLAKEAWRQHGAVPAAVAELAQGRPTAALKELATQTAGAESGAQSAADLFHSISRNLGTLARRVTGNKMSVEDAQLLLDTEAGMAKMRSDTVEGKGPLTGHVIDAMHTAAQGYGEDFKINPENVKAAAEVLNPLWVVGMGGAGKVAGAAEKAGKFAAVDAAGRVVAESATKAGAEAAVKTYTTAAGDWLKSWGAAQEGKAAPAIFGSRWTGGAIGAGVGSMIGGPLGTVLGTVAGGVLSPLARTATAKLAEGAGGMLARAGETLPFRAAEAITGAAATGAAHAAKPWGSTANVLFGTAGISELLGGSPEKAGELFGGALSFGGGLGAAGATAGVAREALHTAASRVVSAAYTPPKDFVGVEQPQTYGEKEFASEPALDASTAEYVANRGDAAANRFEYLRQKMYNLLGLKIFVAPTAEAYVNAVGELGSKADPTQPGYFNFDKKTIVLNQNTLAAGHEIGHVFDSILSKVEDGALIHKYNQGLLDAHGEDFVASKGKMYLEALGVNTEGMTKDRFIEAGLDELRPEMISNLLRGAPLGAQKSPMLRWVNLWLAGVAEKTGLYTPQEGRGPASQSDVYGWGSSPLADRTVRQHVEQLLGMSDKAVPRPPRLWPEEQAPKPVEGTLTPPPKELRGETSRYVEPPKGKPVGPETARLLKEYGFSDQDIEGMTRQQAEAHLDRLHQTGAPTVSELNKAPGLRVSAEELSPNSGVVPDVPTPAGVLTMPPDLGPATGSRLQSLPSPGPEVVRQLRAYNVPEETISGLTRDEAVGMLNDLFELRGEPGSDGGKPHEGMVIPAAEVQAAAGETPAPAAAPAGIEVKPKSKAVWGITEAAQGFLDDIDAGAAAGTAPRFPAPFVRRIANDHGYIPPAKGVRHPWWRKTGVIEAPQDLVDFLRRKREVVRPSGGEAPPREPTPPTPPPEPAEPVPPSTDIHAAEPPGTREVLEAPSNVDAPKRTVPGAEEVAKLAPEESKADVAVATKAAQDGNALVLQYGSVRTEGTPGEQKGSERRAEQAVAYDKEAQGAMDSETRTWVDKAVIPTGWLIRNGNNINLQTFSISAAVGNAQHLIRLLEKSKLLDRIPTEYGYNQNTRSLSEAGWKTYVSNLRMYLENHSHGFGGDGTLLQKPVGWSGEWQSPTPGYVPHKLSPTVRDFMNASMGNTITPPKTARSQGANKALVDYPAVGATKTAQAAGLTVVPRGMYVHPETKATAMYGEPNPLRQSLFSSGVDLGKELVSVNAELNLEHIKDARDGGSIGRFNTQFGRSGFAVSPAKLDSKPKTGKGLDVRGLDKTSGNTAIVRSKPSTAVTYLLEELKGGRTLHQGAGQPGNPDRALLDSITETVHFDPNHSPETADKLNKGDFDKVITPFVVNTLPVGMREIVYETAAQSVKPGGKVYIAARGTQDVPVEGKPGWKSSGDGWLVKNKGEINFQRGYTPEQLKAEAEQYFKEVKILRKGSAPIIEASKPILKGTQ